MRKITPAVICAVALSLGGCSTWAAIKGGGITVDAVLADIRTGCTLNANAQDITTLINSQTFQSAEAVASAVCKVFETSRAGTRLGGPRTLMVKGVAVRVERP